jgi:hypothetical protein
MKFDFTAFHQPSILLTRFFFFLLPFGPPLPDESVVLERIELLEA